MEKFLFFLFVLLFSSVHPNHVRNHNHHRIHDIIDNPIPILSVSLNMDMKHYLKRLLLSIDYPISLICIQIGNPNREIVNDIVQDIQEVLSQNRFSKQTVVQVFTTEDNPGSANGFNFGLKNMMNIDEASWVLVTNSDISFYPGVLKRLSHAIQNQLHHNSQFGIGFTGLCCGSEWSVVAFTRRLVSAVGYFDENFYPAYYEDDDYAIRIHLSGYQATRFQNISFLHGEIDGSKDYLSGVFSSLYMTKTKDPTLTSALDQWRQEQQRGEPLSKSYFQRKWGIQMTSFTDKKEKKMDCKGVAAINRQDSSRLSLPLSSDSSLRESPIEGEKGHPPGQEQGQEQDKITCEYLYRTPFGRSNETLRDWTLNQTMRAIIKGKDVPI